MSTCSLRGTSNAVIIIIMLLVCCFYLQYHCHTDWWARCDQLPPHNWDHSPLSQDNGVRLWALKDSGHLHTAEDTAGWDWTLLHLSDLWAILSRCYCPREFERKCVWKWCFISGLWSNILHLHVNLHVLWESTAQGNYCVECFDSILIPYVYFLFTLWMQGKMVQQLAKEPSARLLKHVVRCYLRLSDNLR